MRIFPVVIIFAGIHSYFPKCGLAQGPEERMESHQKSHMTTWCYQEPLCGETTWGGKCSSGQLQSPIHLKSTVPQNNIASGGSCFLKNFPRSLYTSNFFSMESNGRTLGVKLLDSKPKFFWSEQNATYLLHSFHFHWGSGQTGAEHTIDGKNFPLEIQMVHYDDTFESIGSALQSRKRNALAIISILFQVGGSSLALQPIFKFLPGVLHPNAVIMIKEGLDLRLLMRGGQVWSYMGSLTSPGCDEQVAWLVWNKPARISLYELSLFRSIKDTVGKPLRMNYRHPQPIHNRKVELCEVTIEKNKRTN